MTNKHQFFIDLFTEQKISYPAPIKDIFTWIRENQANLDKKFLVYYLITKDLGEIAAQNNSELTENFAQWTRNFLLQFNMTDKEINYLSGLVRLDLLIEKADAIRDNEGSYHYKKTEGVTSLSKEICQ